MNVQQACKSLKQKGANVNEHQVHKRLENAKEMIINAKIVNVALE